MNDTGVLAYAYRDTTSTGLLDVYRKRPGQSLELLPSFGQSEVLQNVMIDCSGRVAVPGLITSPSYRLDLWRYDDSSGWQNLTGSWGGILQIPWPTTDGIAGWQPYRLSRHVRGVYLPRWQGRG